MKIGFFDSGLGGLTILKTVVNKLPQYDYEFYGDTANLPYGDKKEAEIFELTKKGVTQLFEKGCILVIIACNTASAETLRKLQTEFLPRHYPKHKILGVIIPTIETLLEHKIDNVILIGTNRTIKSQKYQLELKKYDSLLNLRSLSTPELVPLIESNKLNEALTMICSVIDESKEEQGIILGCTHYSLFSDHLISRYKKANFTIFSQDKIIPNKLEKYLGNHPEIRNKLSKNQRNRNIFLTKNTERYDELLKELITRGEA